MTLVELFEHYREQIVQPEWTENQETIDEGLAALTWTFRDDAENPWFGVLLIVRGDDGRWWVRQWNGSGAFGPIRLDEQGRDLRAPAPSRTN